MKKQNIKFALFFLCVSFLLFFSVSVSAATLQTKIAAPGQPKLISAKAVGADSIKLQWKSAEKATHYAIYYRVDGKWNKIAMIKADSTVYTHKDNANTPLVPGKTYTYTVKAFRIIGDGYNFGGFDKKGVQVKLPVTKLNPSAIKSIVSSDYNKMQISWKPVPGAEGYGIYTKINGEWRLIAKTTSTTYTHTSSSAFPLVVGNTYRYSIRSYLDVGGKRFWGNLDKTGKKRKCLPHTPDLVSVSMTGREKVTVKWKAAPGATNYVVYYKEVGSNWKRIAVIDASQTEYIHQSSETCPLVSHKNYLYTLRAYNKNGEVYSSYDKNGLSLEYVTAVNEMDEKVQAKAREIIARLTTPDMTPHQKLVRCWYWIMGADYRPSANPDLTQPYWKYQCAYDILCSHMGNCYGFATGFAAFARELGYEPYVICIPRVHCFVLIDGGYWDNMGGKQGVPTRPMEYTEKQIEKF